MARITCKMVLAMRKNKCTRREMDMWSDSLRWSWMVTCCYVYLNNLPFSCSTSWRRGHSKITGWGQMKQVPSAFSSAYSTLLKHKTVIKILYKQLVQVCWTEPLCTVYKYFWTTPEYLLTLRLRQQYFHYGLLEIRWYLGGFERLSRQ